MSVDACAYSLADLKACVCSYLLNYSEPLSHLVFVVCAEDELAKPSYLAYLW
jgi:hypothetical protein